MEQTLGERLKALRQQNGLTQEQLADRLHVTRQAVAKWENDNGTPDVENLMRLADAFGVTLDTLVGRNAAPESETIDAVKNEPAAQAEPASDPSTREWFKNRPQLRLFAAIAFTISWGIWLIAQAEIYSSIGASASWALALVAMVASGCAAVMNFVRYFKERRK